MAIARDTATVGASAEQSREHKTKMKRESEAAIVISTYTEAAAYE